MQRASSLRLSFLFLSLSFLSYLFLVYATPLFRSHHTIPLNTYIPPSCLVAGAMSQAVRTLPLPLCHPPWVRNSAALSPSGDGSSPSLRWSCSVGAFPSPPQPGKPSCLGSFSHHQGQPNPLGIPAVELLGYPPAPLCGQHAVLSGLQCPDESGSL